MYGRDINQLNVKLGSTDVFQKSGSQGNQWKKAEFSINGSGDVRKYFTLYFVKTFLNLKIFIRHRRKFHGKGKGGQSRSE